MGYSKLEVVENASRVIISTARLSVLVDKKRLETKFQLAGNIINER